MMLDDDLAVTKTYVAQPYENRRGWLERPVVPEHKAR